MEQPQTPNIKRQTPLVGIIMGSDSDLNIMQAAADVLAQFQIPFELTIVSAHRTPQRMFDYAQSAKTRGLKVIIAGAGGAAHLPGMVASLTTLPVIGVRLNRAIPSMVGTRCFPSCKCPVACPLPRWLERRKERGHSCGTNHWKL